MSTKVNKLIIELEDSLKYLSFVNFLHSIQMYSRNSLS